MRVSARVALVSLIIATGGFAGCSSLNGLSDAPSEELVSPENPSAKIAPGEETSEFRQRRANPEHRRPTRRQRRKTRRRKSRNVPGMPRFPRGQGQQHVPRRRSRKRLRASRCNIHGRLARESES